MDNNANKRPTIITVFGVIFIIISVVLILKGLGYFLFATLLKHFAKDFMNIAKDPEIVSFFLYYDYIYISVSLSIIFGIFILIASIHFIKLRAWARTALEAAFWIALICITANLIPDAYFFNRQASSIMDEIKEENALFSSVINSFFWVILIIRYIFYAAPLIVFLKYLRGKKIKDALSLTQVNQT